MAGSFPRLDPAGTRETFNRSFSLTDSETGDAIELGGVTAIIFEIQDPTDHSIELSAGIGDGVTLGTDDDGLSIFTVRFESDEMGSLCARIHDIRCVISTADGDSEVFGTLPVVS
jgi:hypothetical protein